MITKSPFSWKSNIKTIHLSSNYVLNQQMLLPVNFFSLTTSCQVPTKQKQIRSCRIAKKFFKKFS